MKTSLLISVLSHLPIYITTIYSTVVYKKLPRELKVFTWFLIPTSIIQFISLVLALATQNNMPLLHVYVLVSFVTLAWFYIEVLNEFINKKIIWLITILFILFSIINSLFFQPIHTFASHALTVEAIIIIVFSISTFILFLNQTVKENKKELADSLHWINSGLFVYYTSNLLIYYFGNTITHLMPQKFNLYAWVLHSLFSIIMYCCFCIGIWKHPKE